MDSLRACRCQFWYTLIILVSIQGKILCSSTYQVGNLDAWGIPPSSNPQVYTKWTQFLNLTIGDSLFFLYPPSQDSVIQVRKDSFNSCNLKDPILTMNDGNSLFNITKGGNYYFTSGVDGHCQKNQKLHISVYGNGSSADSDDADAPSPSYTPAFGSIPVQGANSTSPSSSSPLMQIPVLISAAAAILSLCF